MDSKLYTVIKDGTKEKESYDTICKNLGFIASVHFVSVTTAGSIGFTCGKQEEIRALLSAVDRNGYKASKALVKAANG